MIWIWLALAAVADDSRMTSGFRSGELHKVLSSHTFRTGILDGYRYQYYADFSSGNVAGGWRLSCRTDPMDDTAYCSVKLTQSDRLALYIGYGGDSYLVCVGLNNYPGSDIEIRIDSNTAHSDEEWCFSLRESAAILNEIQPQSKMITRYEEWPSVAWLTSEFKTEGLSQALTLAAWMHEQTEQGSVLSDEPEPTAEAEPVLLNLPELGSVERLLSDLYEVASLPLEASGSVWVENNAIIEVYLMAGQTEGDLLIAVRKGFDSLGHGHTLSAYLDH